MIPLNEIEVGWYKIRFSNGVERIKQVVLMEAGDVSKLQVHVTKLAYLAPENLINQGCVFLEKAVDYDSTKRN